jgi:polyphosphate glucokinase
MKVLVVDIGGTHVKALVSGQKEARQFDSGPDQVPKNLVAETIRLVDGWRYDVLSIGYPGPVLRDRPIAEPHNLGRGWVGFDFEKAFGRPVKVVNDAALQALGSYQGGKMLFLGLGTGLGSALVVDGIVEPMELSHLPYRKRTYEHYVGEKGLKREGKAKWRRFVDDVVARFVGALEPDDVVLGGGNARLLKELPPKCRVGSNANAFVGGFRLWKSSPDQAERKQKRQDAGHRRNRQRTQR